jgi:dihydropteroate synthase
MGIVNVTPDSFSDGGRYFAAARQPAVRIATSCWRTAPTSSTSAANPAAPARRRCRWKKNWRGCCPVVREAVALGVPHLVDTYKPEVMRQVLDLGADIVNDIWALRSRARPRWWRATPAAASA